MNIENVYNQFSLKGEIASIVPITIGHINDTYRLINKFEVEPDYLLQRVNSHVFRDVIPMMENIENVISYIQQQMRSSSLGKLEGFESLELIKTGTGSNLVVDMGGEYWRTFVFKKNLTSYEKPNDANMVYECANTFGHFLYLLNQYPTDKLNDTIPNFHNLPIRLTKLQQVLNNVEGKRKEKARNEIAFIWRESDRLCEIQNYGDKGNFKHRVTHNDTKLNNVLFDVKRKGRCVVDLDTVMPGYVHFDFGDGIRTTISAASEDEQDVDKIHINLDLFEAFAAGYLEKTRDILNRNELKFLGLSGVLMAFMMGVRFLTDYLEGDVYYKVDFQEQNFYRARCQLTLAKRLLEQLEDMNSIIVK